MDLNGKTVWQHAAGDAEHDHADLCLEHDVIVSNADSASVLKDNGDMLKGDVLVLKAGASRVRGVGVLGDYVYLGEEEAFDDIDGWTLPHGRRVSWLWKGEHRFQGKPFTRPTTQRCWKGEVRKWLVELEPNAAAEDLAPLPDAGTRVGHNDIARYLFSRGVRSDSIRSLLDPGGEFMRMANWYNGWKWDHSPSEHETVAHLVVPLLRILGWTPPRIAIEYGGASGRADIALLSGLTRQNSAVPRDGAQVAAVLEAKKVRSACLSGAASQVENYAREHEALRAIATDGLRYGVFWRSRTDQEFKRGAYLNLIHPRDDYPIYDCSGAMEAIWAMTPDWQPEPYSSTTLPPQVGIPQ